MRTHFDCFPCFLKQVIRTGLSLDLGEEEIWGLLKQSAGILAEMDIPSPPPKNAVKIYDAISRYTGNEDPFRGLKKDSIEQALALYPEIKRRVSEHRNPVEAAVRYAASGNVIDYGVGSSYDLLSEIESVLEEDFFSWDFDAFEERLRHADWLLFLGDNCGETVFDRLLIETIGKPVTFVVRDAPIINDVTMEDAVSSGLDKVATIVSSGCRAPGIILEWCSESFLELFRGAPLIISKGQGNFESLVQERREIFFLFKIKCKVVAEYLSAPPNTMFFGKGPHTS